jgi:hypothetical protein
MSYIDAYGWTLCAIAWIAVVVFCARYFRDVWPFLAFCVAAVAVSALVALPVWWLT